MKNKNIYIDCFFFKEYLSLGPLGKKIDEWNQSWSLIAEHWASLIGSLLSVAAKLFSSL